MPRVAVANRVTQTRVSPPLLASAIPQTQNLLVHADDGNDAVWSKTNCTIVSGRPDPAGGAAAWQWQASGAGAIQHFISNAATPPLTMIEGGGRIVTLSAFAKPVTGQWLLVSEAQHSIFYSAWFDLSGGVTGSTLNCTNKIELGTTYYGAAGAGWFRVSLQATIADSEINQLSYGFFLSMASADASNFGAYDAGTSPFKVDVYIPQYTTVNRAGPAQQTSAARVNTGPLRSTP
jgi:hypothetical protein